MPVPGPTMMIGRVAVGREPKRGDGWTKTGTLLPGPDAVGEEGRADALAGAAAALS